MPLIGFAGAPFTLASYLVEGGPSRDHARTKALLWGEPAVWDRLLARARRHRGAAPAGAGRRGGERAAGVRLVGRRARARHLPRARAAAHAAAVRRDRRPRRADDPLRRRDRRAARRDGRGRRRRDRHRRARAAGRGLGAHRRSGRARRPGQPRPDGAACRRGRRSRPRRSTCSRAPAAATVTSSTSGTACCRPRRWSTCSAWSTWCTSAPSARPRWPAGSPSIGGGVSGLTAAYRLRRRRASTSRCWRPARPPGGKLRSVEVGGLRLPAGPDSFLARKPWAVELCRELGIGDELVAPRASGAFLWTPAGLVPYPTGTAFGIPGDLGDAFRWPGLSRRGRASRAARSAEAEAPRRRRRVARLAAAPPARR